MKYLYLFLAVLSSSCSGIFFKKISLQSEDRKASIVMPAFWFLILTAVFGSCMIVSNSFQANAYVLLPALLASLGAVMSASAIIESMKNCAFSIAIIIVNLNFVFPILLSMLFLNEAVNGLQLIGMLIAIAVIVFINLKKGEGKKASNGVVLAIIGSVGNGVLNFAIKVQQYYTPGKGEYAFFFWSYLFAALVSILVFVAFRVTKKSTGRIVVGSKKTFALSAIGIAACNGICFFLINKLTGFMNAAAEFTIVTTLSIIISLLVGLIRMKEKLTVKVLCTLGMAIVAIICQHLNLA